MEPAAPGNHEDSGELLLVELGGSRVDFHRSSAWASAAAAGDGETVDDERFSNWDVST
jgi:hypothetical protein